MFQNNFGQQQQFQAQNRYQPVGFVQSQYQGIPKSPSQSFSSSSFSSNNSYQQPVISHVGYTAGNSQSFSNQPSAFSNQSFGGGFSNTSFNPVLSHAGSSAGQSFNYQSHGPVQAQTSSYTPVINHFGGSSSAQNIGGFQSAGQSQARSSYQPVISHVGYTAGQDFNNQSSFSAQPSFGSSFSPNAQSSFASNSFSPSAQSFASNSFTQAQTPYNPVLQATQQQQNSGPVISHVGYSAGSQQGFNNQRF
ncbi:hypothetical protein ACFFSY_32075 [Paenibacillus aurantiacus]|uniref:Uncharacterized protein n=1 Tax=Paenibacillus aurantiacus TaxID=1936118 RepID=A0ABV5KZI7_9BACL